MKRFLIRLLTLALAATALFSILGYFGRTHWFLDLFSHFKVQYLLILAIGTSIIFLVKKKLTPIFLPFLIALLVEVIPLYFGGNRNEDLAESTTILCINLLSSNTQFEMVEEYLNEKSPDILILQEFSTRWQSRLESQLDSYPYQLAIPRKDNFGIAVYSRSTIAKLQEIKLGNAGVPSISGEIRLGKSMVKLIATHPLPPVGTDYFEHRNSQLAELGSLISKQEGEVIVIGDLNTSSFSTHFKRLVSNTELIDTRKGFGILTTWPTWLSLVRTTLDHCLITEGISVKSREVGENIGSDHLPIFVELGVE